MEGQIIFNERGDFGYDWNLVVTTPNTTKRFYLGQDAKFCSRVLGMRPGDITRQIGDNDLRKVETQKKLGNFILNVLGITEEQIENLQEWELCCQ
jgi:hypothetical protein